MIADAKFDASKIYRYRLWRFWENGPRVVFIMLNPSTADQKLDDPTIRRCIDYGRAWGCGSIDVANLFAFRATKPTDLRNVLDPIGPENDAHLVEAANGARWVVAAWGAYGKLRARDKAVRELLREHTTLHYLKLT